jgi:hypothetical protein
MSSRQCAKFLLRSALIAALLGSGAVALAAPVSMQAGDLAIAKAGSAKAARIYAILDRWTPVAQELGQDAALWRDMMGIQLSMASDGVLRTLAELEPDADAKGGQKDRAEAYKTFIATLGADMHARHSEKPATKILGSTTIDQVFTPITPCRIVDTRNVGGPISAGVTRNYYFYSVDSLYNFGTNQGGASGAIGTVCPSVYFDPNAGTGSAANVPSAAMITVSVVSPSAAGNWVVWGGANPIPTISALNWTGTGQILTNTTVVPYGGRGGTGPGGSIRDFAVYYNGPSGSAQFIADVVGYFTPPFGTALSCVETAQNTVSCAASGGQCELAPPACPSGYNNTAINCDTSNFFTYNSGFNINRCYWHNTAGSTTTGYASRHCCRVNGR